MTYTPPDMLFDDNEFIFLDGEKFVFNENEDDTEERTRNKTEPCWKIMIVDDDLTIHMVTKLSLKKFRFEGKALTFISAYSGKEAKRLIKDHANTALILLDVVMESKNAGLMVAKHVREVLQNDEVRIILRTGQPGEAPEHTVFQIYDINDYKTKTELTQQKLFTTIMSALRSYRDITTIKASQKELEALYADLAQRNLQLAQANEQLQQEIAERKKLESIRLEQERLRIEKEFLEKQAQQLAKLNADKDKFFSIMAHDLKGPFQPLLGYSQLMALMAETMSPAEITQMSEKILSSAKTVYGLLENLLEWSRMQLGQMRYQPQDVSLKELIDDNLRLLAENAVKKEITLQSEVNEHLEVYADRHMLDTVIRNLISNALKFTPSGGKVTISAREDKRQHPSGLERWMEVSVVDTGIGISQTDLKMLFKLDSHHTTPGTAEEQGTGLGLIICKEMVEKNGGQIWIESQLEQGTTVRFSVPVVS
ncbi:MAG: ATP-binding protein [Ardenticatenaceae bacterium]